MISPDTPKNEEELMDTLFLNLAMLHETAEKPWEELLPFIKDQYITHHAYDWYCDQNMSGAFAYFGPGQFSRMWPEIIKPNGWLYLIGEAASAHHAWLSPWRLADAADASFAK
jgi:monoamine oxidase